VPRLSQRPGRRAARPGQAAAELHRPAASARLTLAQHRELLVTAGWLALLLGCVHYDLGEREQAEAARQAACQAGLQAGHGEIIAWSYEMAAWFALTRRPLPRCRGYRRQDSSPAPKTA
jgi:hypothetical protein